MSYLQNLSTEEISDLKEVKTSIRDYYNSAKASFIATYPQRDFTQHTLILENLIFSGNCDFTGDFECAIEFKNCFFLNDVIFYDVKFNKKVWISHCFVDREMRITKNSHFLSEFDLIVLSIKSQLYVEGGMFNECKWSIIQDGIVKINGGQYSFLNIGYWGGVFLKELSFHFPAIKGLIKITGDKSKIQNLTLFQFSSEVSISIEDITVNTLTIYRYRNEKNLRFSNIKSFETENPSEFSIVESFLGKAEFYSVNLKSFKRINLLDVHLVDCSFVNMLWNYDIKSFKGRGIGKSKDEEKLPDKIALIEQKSIKNYFKIRKLKSEGDVLQYYFKNREVFRQLKYSLSKQGDVVNEQKFHTKEMLAYDKSLLVKKSFWTKIVIKFSHLFSDFGQSLHRPLLALVIGHWILLLLLILFNQFDNLYLSVRNPTWKGFEVGFEYYFKLINPLRRAENTFSGYNILIDLLMRIWSSYMIYNIIRATRRFIK